MKKLLTVVTLLFCATWTHANETQREFEQRNASVQMGVQEARLAMLSDTELGKLLVGVKSVAVLLPSPENIDAYYAVQREAVRRGASVAKLAN